MIQVFSNQPVWLKKSKQLRLLDVRSTVNELKEGTRGTVTYGGTRAVRFDGSAWYEV